MPTPANAPATPVPLPPAGVRLTVKQLHEQQPGLALGGIRWAIFNAEHNGLKASGAISRMGRRVLIDPDKFLKWLETNPRLSPPKPRPGRGA